MRVLALKLTPEGIFRYRTENQLEGIDHEVVNPSGKWIEAAAENPPDVVHLSYAGSPDLLAELMALRKLRRVPFVVDCDDLFTDVPEYNQSANAVHPASPAYRIRVAMLTAADVVTVSTPTLADMLRTRLGVDPVVVPNFVKPVWFDAVQRPKPPKEVRIMFTGASGGRWGDMEFIRPAIEDAAQRPNVKVALFGTFPQWALAYQNIYAVRWTPVSHYFAVMRHLNADIGLAPLLPNDFNRSKSGIKYYEYAMAGAAGVYSDLDPYRDVRDRVTGIVVPHDVDAWRAALNELIDNAALRAMLASQARTDVLAHHASGGTMESVLRNVCGIMAPEKEVAHALP